MAWLLSMLIWQYRSMFRTTLLFLLCMLMWDCSFCWGRITGTRVMLQEVMALWSKPVAFPGKLWSFVVFLGQRAGVLLPQIKRWVRASDLAAALSFWRHVTPWPGTIMEWILASFSNEILKVAIWLFYCVFSCNILLFGGIPDVQTPFPSNPWGWGWQNGTAGIGGPSQNICRDNQERTPEPPQVWEKSGGFPEAVMGTAPGACMDESPVCSAWHRRGWRRQL